jgi:hypothetical protein
MAAAERPGFSVIVRRLASVANEIGTVVVR